MGEIKNALPDNQVNEPSKSKLDEAEERVNKQQFTVNGRFCSLNEFYRFHAYKQGDVKKANDRKVKDAALEAGIKPVDKCILHITWYEPNHRRDLDNIAFGKKFICDGLVKAGILKDDCPHHVVGFTDAFGYDKENPRIEVEIEEVK